MSASLAREPYVFLSYSHQERDRAQQLAEMLQAHGIAVWLDRTDIAGGTSWNAEIVRGIRECGALALLASQAAVQSRNVGRELQLAVEFERPVLPLLLEAVTFPDEMRYAIAGVQRVDLLDQPEAVWLPAVLNALARLGITSTASPDGAFAVPTSTAESARTPPMNLPSTLTSFVGREQEVADLIQLVDTARLVSVTGPGGTGKTRLALTVAERLVDSYRDGVFLVDLSAISDSSFVPAAIAQALGVREVQGQPITETLKVFLRDRRMLLILDNFEQILDAAPLLPELLIACPNVRLLVTSRVVLHVSGEHEYALLPLPVPDSSNLPPLSTLAENPAVSLFADRAQAVKAGFSLSLENAPAVATICQRLDGLPLAIELAAARSRLLSPQALVARLTHRLPLLTGGGRDLPRRQQTLRSTIQWSYDLLSATEQALFTRLVVFTGGFTLEAAEAVCDPVGEIELDVLEGIGWLVDKSLLKQHDGSDGEPRFTMLPTIAEFGAEQLEASVEAPTIRKRHAEYFARLAEQAEPVLMSAGRQSWMQQFQDEHENVRAALRWTLESGETELGLRVAGALTQWFSIMAIGEGRRWTEDLLAQPWASTTETSRRARAKAHLTAGTLAYYQGEQQAAAEHFHESVAAWRSLEHQTLQDQRGLALALMHTCGALRAEPERARVAGEEAVAVARQAGDSWALAYALGFLASALLSLGDISRASATAAEGVAVARTTSDSFIIAVPLIVLGRVALHQGDLVAAKRSFEQSLALHGALNFLRSVGMILIDLGLVSLEEGELATAAQRFAEALAINRDAGLLEMAASALQGVAGVAWHSGQPKRAAVLCGASDALLQAAKGVLLPTHAEIHQRTRAAVQAALGEDAFAAAWNEGAALSLDAAVVLALEQTHAPAGFGVDTPRPS